MRTYAKAGVVIAGYAGALLVAGAVVTVYIASTAGPDRQTYGGMYAFGDSLLFLAAFGVAAAVPTSGALYFLRPHPWFWRALSGVAVVIEATGLAAFLIYLAGQAADPSFFLPAWSPLAVLRILSAPLFALAFFLSGLFAPNRSSRLVCLTAAVIEGAVFAYIALTWFLQSRSH